MPVNTALATQVWNRYTYLRDNGHLDYVKKAAKCEDFFAGLHGEGAASSRGAAAPAVLA